MMHTETSGRIETDGALEAEFLSSAAEVRFPSTATIAAVESALEDAFSRDSLELSQLWLDFSATTFIEIAALQHITSFVTDRSRRGMGTKIRLPRGDRGVQARNFLRRWRYPTAFTAATGLPFSKVVAPEDLAYFKGRPEHAGNAADYGPPSVTYELPSGRFTIRCEAHRFFEFCTYKVADYSDPSRLIEDARSNWDVAPVLAVLNRNLRRPKPPKGAAGAATKPDVYVATRVMYEAMTNALRHPKASLIQTASHLSGAPNRPVEIFTLVFWDDGSSMVETLRRPLLARKPIRRRYPVEFDCRFLLIRDDRQGRRSEVVSTALDPEPDASDERLSLAALFPGITCDTEGRNFYAAEELIKADRRLAQPGMGLFVLLNTAIDLFGGSIAFRTRSLFMNVRAASETERAQHGNDVRYRAKIKTMSPTTRPFLGNMVTVRLPILRS